MNKTIILDNQNVAEARSLFEDKIAESVFMITPDPQFGIGLHKIISSYHIICIDSSPVVKTLKNEGVNVFCLEDELGDVNISFRSSRHLLSNQLVIDYISENSKGECANLLFFKLNFSVERLFRDLEIPFRYRVLNNPFEISKQFEDKTNFPKIIDESEITPYKVLPLADVNYSSLREEFGSQIVIQFGRGWAGNSTFFVSDNQDFENLRSQFPSPRIMVKVSPYIEGDVVTVNACVFGESILVGYPFHQVTGIPELTPYPGGTCGNVWTSLEEELAGNIIRITKDVGRKMGASGYKGWFGLDFMVKKSDNSISILENNARLTASVSMFTSLQLDKGYIPLLFYHVLSYLPEAIELDPHVIQEVMSEPLEGSRLIARNVSNRVLTVNDLPANGVYELTGREWEFKNDGYSVIDLTSPEQTLLLSVGRQRTVNPGIELFQVQSTSSFLNRHGVLSRSMMKFIEKTTKNLNLTENDEEL